MRTRLVWLWLLAAIGVPGPVARGAELGDAAPPLQVAEWVKGEPLELTQGRGRLIYVIEFWATWSPQAPVCFEQLIGLHRKFKEQAVVFIGISEEPVTKVKPFVDQLGDQLDFRVAADKERQTVRAYMEGFGVRGLPFAFVVDKAGAVVWHGHPLGGLEATLDRMLAGTYDLGAAKRAAAAERLFGQFLVLARLRTTDAAKLDQMAKRIVADGASNAFLMNEFAWTLMSDPRVRYRNADVVLKAAKAACEASQGNDPAILDTYARILFETGSVQEAIKHQERAAQLAKDPALKAQMIRTLKRYQEKASK